ncbi:hypothetical protein COCOBI_10-0780 [Coccomyxa sp. Obi]|nr:hypothetical protein COCOBI_10-0780 [Coccomyxa sp. Obi]
MTSEKDKTHGDSEDVSPTYYKDGDADVAGVPSGVSARPQQPHETPDRPPTGDPGQNAMSSQEPSRDPHEADIPDYPGINPKNQAEADAKDSRRMPRGSDRTEKPPGNWPGTKTDRLSGDFQEDVNAPTQRSGGDNTPPAEPQGGPTGGQAVEKTDIKDVADPEGIKWGKGPESPADPKTAYQNR